MINYEMIELLRHSPLEWNEWREANTVKRINLCGANLIYANLTGANLSRANLTYADISGATFCCATIDGAMVAPGAIGGPGHILYALTEAEAAWVERGRMKTGTNTNV